MFLLIDNYDSFVYNLVHYLGELGTQTIVRRNDVLSVDDALAPGALGPEAPEAPEAIVISPGPSVPDNAGICLDLVRAAAQKGIPVLGVCLGHQIIGQAFGGVVVRAPEIMHGKVSRVRHDGGGVFKGLDNPLLVTRYHSLVVERDGLPGELEIMAETENGLIMGLQHKEFPLYGVQFHPESIASQSGHALLANFITLATGRVVDKIPEPKRVPA